MVKNLTAIFITIAKGIKVIQVVAANGVSQEEGVLGKLKKLDEIQSIQQTSCQLSRGRDALPATRVVWPVGVVRKKTKQLPESY